VGGGKGRDREIHRYIDINIRENVSIKKKYSLLGRQKNHSNIIYLP
jgi:hypothetical protein